MADISTAEEPVTATDNLVYIPISPPAASDDFQPAEPKPEQSEMYSKVLDHFSQAEYALPGLENGQLTDQEKLWLSYECLFRYLRATKWQVTTTIQRLEDTLKWRREFGLYDLLSAEHVEPEAVTGKEILFGYDTSRRPAFYMIPSRQNTDEATRQVQFAVWMLERAVDQMGPGVENLDLLINFADKAKNPSLSTARTVLNILQTHYPERLGLALVINVPWVITLFLKAVTPFIDPVTREKIKMNPVVVKDGIFTPDMVMSKWWGGSVDFEYEHEKYWPALVSMCDKRREEQMEKWKQLGGIVGLKEWDVKGGSAALAIVEGAAPVAEVESRAPRNSLLI